jgi:hypothetical protein
MMEFKKGETSNKGGNKYFNDPAKPAKLFHDPRKRATGAGSPSKDAKHQLQGHGIKNGAPGAEKVAKHQLQGC